MIGLISRTIVRTKNKRLRRKIKGKCHKVFLRENTRQYFAKDSHYSASKDDKITTLLKPRLILIMKLASKFVCRLSKTKYQRLLIKAVLIQIFLSDDLRIRVCFNYVVKED